MTGTEFNTKLILKLFQSLSNNYSDNYDKLRFDRFTIKNVIKEKLKNALFNKVIIKSLLKKNASILKEILEQYNEDLVRFYNLLSDDKSKDLLISLVCYRVLGRRYIKLPVNNKDYWDAISAINKLADKTQVIHTNFLGWKLYFFNLNEINYNISIYYTIEGIITDFKLEQYRYQEGLKKIEVNEGDFIIDAGGCWGDTSLYFASKTGNLGKVFSFEFIPSNLEIFYRNISLNPHLRHLITVIDRPVWNVDDKIVYGNDNGPGSTISFAPSHKNEYITKTITIDKFVEENNIERINFIKMDIEGSEQYALLGAFNTINKFKPSLAIAVYHSLNDFVFIPKWINELNLGYKLYLGHYTIHLEETVLFAVIE